MYDTASDLAKGLPKCTGMYAMYAARMTEGGGESFARTYSTERLSKCGLPAYPPVALPAGTFGRETVDDAATWWSNVAAYKAEVANGSNVTADDLEVKFEVSVSYMVEATANLSSVEKAVARASNVSETQVTATEKDGDGSRRLSATREVDVVISGLSHDKVAGVKTAAADTAALTQAFKDVGAELTTPLTVTKPPQMVATFKRKPTTTIAPAPDTTTTAPANSVAGVASDSLRATDSLQVLAIVFSVFTLGASAE